MILKTNNKTKRNVKEGAGKRKLENFKTKK